MKILLLLLPILISCFAQDQQLIPGQEIDNEGVQKFGFNYYYINLTTDESVGFGFQVSQATGNTYLFVQLGSKPTVTNFAYSDTTSNVVKIVTPCVGKGGMWWIGVYGYLAATYSIEAYQRYDYELSDGSSATGSLIQSCFIYYEIIVPENVFLMQILLHEASGSYGIYQFLKDGGLPSVNSYDFQNSTYAANGFCCLSIHAPSAGAWYYGVYSNGPGQKYKTQLQLNGDGDCSFVWEERNDATFV